MRWVAAAVIALSLAHGGCLESRTGATSIDDASPPAADTATPARVELDVLWVIDTSASMCQEQHSLVANFPTFVQALERFLVVDQRHAAIAHDVLCDNDHDLGITAARGVFNTVPAASWPPPCQERRIKQCLEDADCANLDCDELGRCGPAQGQWSCRKPTTPSCLVNPNGSINSSCRRTCTTDSECAQLFGHPDFVCQQPSSNPRDWGCVRPPPTAQCPDPVPPVLDNTTLAHFPCIASIFPNQQKCHRYDSGMAAALMALDVDGPNAAQARRFLRDDAYLLLVFLSNRDDCSVADGRTIAEDDAYTCGLLPTTDEGGPLIPVGHLVNRFRALKSDPAKVLVAAISGDSVAADPQTVASERVAYRESAADPRTCFQQSYVCLSDAGAADFGARYLALGEAFGPNGIFSNICDGAGIGPALDHAAELVVTATQRQLTPAPPR